jgi:iron(III) transport system permease protein
MPAAGGSFAALREQAAGIARRPSLSMPMTSGALAPRRRFDRQPTLLGIISYAVVAFFAFLALYPLALVLLRLVYSNGRFDPAPLASMFSQPDVGVLVFNTLAVVGASSLLALVVGAIMAWINERTDAGMGIISDALPLVPFLLPPIAGAIGWVLLLSDRAGLLNALMRKVLGTFGITLTTGPLNIYSWTGIIFVYTIYAIPYVYLLVSAGLRNVDSSLEEQSRVCGNGLWRTMWLVTIPAVRPSLGAALLLLVWFGFALYSVPAVIGTGAGIEVLPVRLVNLLSFTYPPETARAIGLGMIVVLVVGAAWLIQARILAGGRHATIGGKGHRTSRIELGRWRWAARSVVIVYILLAAVLPMIGLLLVSLNGFWTPNIKWAQLSLRTFREVLVEDAVTVTALNNSLLLGIVGATIGMAAAAIIALFVRKKGAGFARVVDGLIKLPASISTIVLAVGFVLAFNGPPFNLNGTFAILLFAYLALYLPQGAVAADAAAAQVGRELTEASGISGARSTRTLLRVSLPLMMGGLAAGWALLFVRIIGDLTASAILAGTNNPVVGFRILEVYQGGSFATLAALSTVLTVVSAAIVVLLLALTRRRSRQAPAIRTGG